MVVIKKLNVAVEIEDRCIAIYDLLENVCPAKANKSILVEVIEEHVAIYENALNIGSIQDYNVVIISNNINDIMIDGFVD